MIITVHRNWIKTNLRYSLSIMKHLFWKKGTKNFTTPYSIPFLNVLHQYNALHNFQKKVAASNYRTHKRSRLGLDIYTSHFCMLSVNVYDYECPCLSFSLFAKKHRNKSYVCLLSVDVYKYEFYCLRFLLFAKKQTNYFWFHIMM